MHIQLFDYDFTTTELKLKQSQSGAQESNAPVLDTLVLCFGEGKHLRNRSIQRQIRDLFPDAHIAGCSTSGEIQGTELQEGSLLITVVHFHHTQLASRFVPLNKPGESRVCAERLARSIPLDDLRHIFVLSEGLQVNGTELVNGLRSHLPDHVTVTGGLAGDGTRFHETVLWNGEAEPAQGVHAIGLYGDAIEIGFGSGGGWDTFGPNREVTRSDGNTVYELDGESALALYKRYLGTSAKELPGSGLKFPLAIFERDRPPLVRTLLGINEEQQSLIFAGDVPQGSITCLMKSNNHRIVEGAEFAAQTARARIQSPQLAILVSCVGRKMVLQQQVEEELEVVQEALGEQAVLTGFYSYGEICPAMGGRDMTCQLQNQTMTITILSEPVRSSEQSRQQ